MPQVIDELVTILGFDMDSRAGTVLGKFNKGIDSIAQNAKQASIAVVAASAAVSYFVVQLNKASGEVEKLGRVTGISTDTIQEMSFAMEQVGGNAASMQSDLVSLMLSMDSPIPGEFNQGLFLLGISTKKANGELKNVDDVLLDIADKMQGMSKQKQMQWGNKIGISKDTIMLLQEGRGEIERLRKQAAQIPVIIDPENLKNAREFNRQISLIGRVFSFLGQTVASAAGPAIKDIVSGLMEWLKVNKELIQSGLRSFIDGVVEGFVKFVEVIRLINAFVGKFIPSLGVFTDALTVTETVSILVFSALTALAIPLVVLIAQFLLVGAVVAAAGLIINDFVVYLEGGESAIGGLIKKVTELWEVFGEKFPAMADFLGEFFGLQLEILQTFVSFLKGTFFAVLETFISLLKLVAKGWELMAGFAEKGLESLGFGDEEEDDMVLKLQENIKKIGAKVIPEVKEFLEPMQKPIASMWNKAQDWTFEKIQETIESIQSPAKAIQEKTEEPAAKVGMVQEKLQALISKIQEKVQEPIGKMQIEILNKIAENATMELKKLNVNGNISEKIEAVSAPIAPISTYNNAASEQSIVNNVNIAVTGDNAPAIASKVSSKLKTTLYQLYPGGLAPAVQ